jgi:tetratricopeptide (TPR) repeat protein
MAGIWIVYGQVAGFDFVSVDDQQYVTSNPPVQAGLKWATVAWAFTTSHACNWHPATWISHALDCQLYGRWAGGHHLTNVLLHTANALLLFGLLLRMTGRRGLSFFVAALFGWHPMHVESVAWIAERKDVLSGLFFMLTLWAYLDYVRQPGAWRYAAAVAFFTVGLLCKPMLVTMPFVLLLLDYWPLGRMANSASQPAETWKRLAGEKAPFLFLAVVSSVVTFIAQEKGGAMVPLAAFSAGSRVANAFVSVLRYVGKLLWPRRLVVIYQVPSSWPAGLVAAAVVFAVAVLAGAWLLRRRQPWLAMGWFWFLGMLAPVIGLVQVGVQSMADRYTYLPSIGLFIMVAWGLDALAGRFRLGRIALAAAAGLALGGCLWTARLQAAHWRDSESLYRHAMEATPENSIPYNNLAVLYVDRHETKKAMALLLAAIALSPGYGDAHYNLGGVYDTLKRRSEAAAEYETALKIDPRNSMAIYKLANVFLAQGDTAGALAHYRAALAGKTNFAEAHYQLAIILTAQGEMEEGMKHFREAVRLKPDWMVAMNNLAWILATCPEARYRDGKQALELAGRAVELTRTNEPGALDTEAAAYAECGRFAEAKRAAAKAVSLARTSGDAATEKELEARLRLYEQSRPFREPVKAAARPGGAK